MVNSLSDGRTVRFSLKDLKRKTLRPLLNEFKKFNGNDDLIREIDRLIDKRNDLAHRAFFEMYDQLLDGEDLSALRSNALETADQAGKCVEKLIQEIHSIEDLCEKEGLITKMPATKNKRNGTF